MNNELLEQNARLWYEDLNESSHFGHSRQVAECLIGEIKDKGIIDGINWLQNPDDSFVKKELDQMNTFPFGEETDEMYSEYLGICIGKTKLKDLFKSLKIQLEIVNRYLRMGERQITVFTDKWSDKEFNRVREGILDAIRHGVYINIFLVSDYGISRIPLPDRESAEKTYKEFKKKQFSERKIYSLSDIEKKVGSSHLKFSCSLIERFGPNDRRQTYSEEYDFNLEDLKYTYKNSKDEVRSGSFELQPMVDVLNNLLMCDGYSGFSLPSPAHERCEIEFGDIGCVWLSWARFDDSDNVIVGAGWSSADSDDPESAIAFKNSMSRLLRSLNTRKETSPKGLDEYIQKNFIDEEDQAAGIAGDDLAFGFQMKPKDMYEVVKRSENEQNFCDLLNEYVRRSGYSKPSEIYNKAQIARGVWSDINKGNKKPQKRTVIAIAVALELSLKETEALLKTLGLAFSDSELWDVIVKKFFIVENHDIGEINKWIDKYKAGPLLGTGYYDV